MNGKPARKPIGSGMDNNGVLATAFSRKESLPAPLTGDITITITDSNGEQLDTIRCVGFYTVMTTQGREFLVEVIRNSFLLMLDRRFQGIQDPFVGKKA